MKLYAEDTTDNLFNGIRQRISSLIDSETENYILNVGEAQYIGHLKSKFIFNFPEIHTDKVYIDTYEANVPATRFPREFTIMDRNKTFKKDIVVYHIPYTGDIDLLRYRPNTYTTSIGNELLIDSINQTIKLEFVNYYNDPVRIKKEYDDCLRRIFDNYNYLKIEIESLDRKSVV